MYPSLEELQKLDVNEETRPHFICEYAHAMGNAIGNLEEYWDLIEGSNRIIGGCIWDWVDQAIYHPQEIKSGSIKGFYTGYDFPGPHQGNFCSNGILTADRQETPKLAEVKRIYQNAVFSGFHPTDQTFELRNKYNFSDLNKYDLSWEVLQDGVVVETGTSHLPSIPAGKSQRIKLAYTTSPVAGSEYLMNVYLITKADQVWAPKGHVMAYDQFSMNEKPALETISPNTLTGKLKVNTTKEKLTVTGTDFSASFDLTNGVLTSMIYGNKEMLYEGNGFLFNDYRYIENDRYKDTSEYVFTNAQINWKLSKDKKTLTVDTQRELAGKCTYAIQYVFYPNGTIDMTTSFTPLTDGLRRMGLAVSLVPGLEEVVYYGRGPLENYPDRKTGSLLGKYASTVSGMQEHYLKPQTMGNREDLRYVEFIASDRTGLRFTADGQVGFSALHFDDADLVMNDACHEWELKPREEVIVHFDRMHRGLGNASCGPNTLEKYQIPASGSFEYKLRIEPIR